MLSKHGLCAGTLGCQTFVCLCVIGMFLLAQLKFDDALLSSTSTAVLLLSDLALDGGVRTLRTATAGTAAAEMDVTAVLRLADEGAGSACAHAFAEQAVFVKAASLSKCCVRGVVCA